MFICDVARIVLGYNWGSCRSWDWAEEDKRGEMVYVLVALCFRTHRRDWGTHDETGMFPPCIRRDNRVWVWIPGQMLHTYTLTHTLNPLVCWFLSRNWGVFARPVCARCHTRSWLSCICMRENKQPYLGENWGSPLPVAWRRHAVVGSSTFTLQSVSVCVFTILNNSAKWVVSPLFAPYFPTFPPKATAIIFCCLGKCVPTFNLKRRICVLCTRLKRSVCLRVIEWKYDMCVCVCLCVRAREAGRDCVQYNRAQLWSCESRRSDKGCDLARVLSLSPPPHYPFFI